MTIETLMNNSETWRLTGRRTVPKISLGTPPPHEFDQPHSCLTPFLKVIISTARKYCQKVSPKWRKNDWNWIIKKTTSYKQHNVSFEKIWSLLEPFWDKMYTLFKSARKRSQRVKVQLFSKYTLLLACNNSGQSYFSKSCLSSSKRKQN